MLRNHGLVATGATIEETLAFLGPTVQACDIQVREQYCIELHGFGIFHCPVLLLKPVIGFVVYPSPIPGVFIYHYFVLPMYTSGGSNECWIVWAYPVASRAH